MKVQKHPNYFESLLLNGGKVIAKFAMTPGADRAKGRAWEASAVISYGGRFHIRLKANFHGNKAETEEVAKANMVIESILDINTKQEYRRNSYGVLMLSCGVYIPGVSEDETRSAAMRELCKYDSSQYCGIPSEDELFTITALGYEQIVTW